MATIGVSLSGGGFRASLFHVGVLVRRVAQRGRDYEKIMTRSYLEAVKEALDHYFLKQYQGQVVVFNAAELDASNNPDYVTTVVSQLPLP